jgi:hypothetical protein
MSKCQRCRQLPAIWALQYVGDDRPSVSLLGSHYRGFRVTKLCGACKDTVLQEAAK